MEIKPIEVVVIIEEEEGITNLATEEDFIAKCATNQAIVPSNVTTGLIKVTKDHLNTIRHRRYRHHNLPSLINNKDSMDNN